MDLSLYEITFILDPQLEEGQLEEIIKKIERMISDSKGEIVKKDLWGKRRLAYEIRRKQYGFYIYIMFKSTPDLINKIEYDLKLNESVLRFLTIKLTKTAIRQLDKDHKLKKKPGKKIEIPEDHESDIQEVVEEETSE